MKRGPAGSESCGSSPVDRNRCYCFLEPDPARGGQAHSDGGCHKVLDDQELDGPLDVLGVADAHHSEAAHHRTVEGGEEVAQTIAEP